MTTPGSCSAERQRDAVRKAGDALMHQATGRADENLAAGGQKSQHAPTRMPGNGSWGGVARGWPVLKVELQCMCMAPSPCMPLQLLKNELAAAGPGCKQELGATGIKARYRCCC